jgi:hypothetical protein
MQQGVRWPVSKFSIKMKLQGLELEIEGAREDASLISRTLGQQFAGLLQPVGAIIDGEASPVALPSAETVTSIGWAWVLVLGGWKEKGGKGALRETRAEFIRTESHPRHART